MAVTISLALLFGIILAILLRSGSLSIGGAFVAIMFGFFLASTGMAPDITHLTNAVVHALPDL